MRLIVSMRVTEWTPRQWPRERGRPRTRRRNHITDTWRTPGKGLRTTGTGGNQPRRSDENPSKIPSKVEHFPRSIYCRTLHGFNDFNTLKYICPLKNSRCATCSSFMISVSLQQFTERLEKATAAERRIEIGCEKKKNPRQHHKVMITYRHKD